MEDRYAVGRTTGWAIPDGPLEFEYVVHDRAQASAVVASYVAAADARGGNGFRLRTLRADRMAHSIARELNARERGDDFDRFVVFDAPRFLRLDGKD